MSELLNAKIRVDSCHWLQSDSEGIHRIFLNFDIGNERCPLLIQYLVPNRHSGTVNIQFMQLCLDGKTHISSLIEERCTSGLTLANIVRLEENDAK